MLTANTGYNDNDSVYNSGGLSWLTGLSDAAGKIITSLNPQKATPVPTPAAQTSTGMPTWLKPVLYVGGALLVVGLLFAFFRRKG